MDSTIRVFDSHLHIIDPGFEIISNGGYLPPTFTTNDYLERTKGFGVVGGAVVSGSFQGYDQSYLLDALRKLGPRFVGVTQLPPSVSDQEILTLDARGVRAIRFNLYRGGSESLEYLDTLARRVYDLAAWHSEVYVDSRDLKELSGRILKLPAVSLDHLGLSGDGLPQLLELVDHGVRIKASGFGRVDFDVSEVLCAIADVDEKSLMFGSDLPSTRARRPFEDADVTLMFNTLGIRRTKLVLYDNAADFYRLPTLSAEDQ